MAAIVQCIIVYINVQLITSSSKGKVSSSISIHILQKLQTFHVIVVECLFCWRMDIDHIYSIVLPQLIFIDFFFVIFSSHGYAC